MFFQIGLETVHVDIEAFLVGHQLGEVDGETVSVEEFEGEIAVNVLLGMLIHITFEALDALRQGAQERSFFLADDFADQLLLRLDFREIVFHLLHQNR